jgi:hypothetical protein
MRVPAWFERDPDLLTAVREQVAATEQPLIVVVDGGAAFIRGAIAVTDPSGVVEAERFSVEIELAADHPDGVPTVREIDGRIPRVQDRHVNRDGSACVFVIDERWKAWPPGGTLTDFINGPVYDFFVWQAGVELTGTPPFAARPHQVAGVREFYEEAAQTKDPLIVLTFLLKLAEEELDLGEDCYCGRRATLRECHFSRVRLFRGRVSLKRAGEVLVALKNQLLAEASANRRRAIDEPIAGPPPASSLRLTMPAPTEPSGDFDRLRLRSARLRSIGPGSHPSLQGRSA